MTTSRWAGGDERMRAAQLVASLTGRAREALRWRDVSLDAAAEHLLYTALRRPDGDVASDGIAHRTLRIARAALAARPRGRAHRATRGGVAAFVTQPVHVGLFDAIAHHLHEDGVPTVVVDAETRAGRGVPDPRVAIRLREVNLVAEVPALAAHGRMVARSLASPPTAWRAVLGDDHAVRLLAILRRGLGLLAVDAARVHRLLRSTRPGLVTCFSESGSLARLVPPVAHALGIPVVDLPHAEANDPWGTAGVEYDAMFVYGPRARQAIEAAGVPHDRVVEIGPLAYDGLVAQRSAELHDAVRRVVFASQPVDADRPTLRAEVKVEILGLAAVVAGHLSPSELVLVPHPTEGTSDLARLASPIPLPPGVSVRTGGALHPELAGAWLLVTGSSQSALDAVVAGVPAAVVNPTTHPDPVTFAQDGIAAGVRSPADAVALGAAIETATSRHDLAARQRAALGDRIGPLDGRAAERAAHHLEALMATARR